MTFVNQAEVFLPVKMGDVVIKNICGSGVDMIASRSV
jgi:CxxC motif-containing protein